MDLNEEFQNKYKTLLTAYLIFDSYMSVQVVEDSQLQLLAVCCHYLATQSVEERTINIEQYINITDNSVTYLDFKNMILDIKKQLNCNFKKSKIVNTIDIESLNDDEIHLLILLNFNIDFIELDNFQKLDMITNFKENPDDRIIQFANSIKSDIRDKYLR